MSDLHWKTGITRISPNEIRLRGYRLDEMMGSLSFPSVIYLALKGDLPSPGIAALLDAIMVASIDHGASPPSALAARTASSTGAPLNASVAAGLLSINRFHGGAIEDCMHMLIDALQRANEKSESMEAIAEQLIADRTAAGQRIPGIGHRIHTNDPRTAKLFSLAQDAGLDGDGMRLLAQIQQEFERMGKPLPINVDGAIAAILVDLDFPPELGNAFFFISRTPGLVAHVYEEQTRERPMRRIHPTDHGYDGPEDRALEV
ncbi:MAG: citryl-CoA lyase [Anaerolineales bacterium]|nr:citryl-CoA lyase [Anaerolineales bacterium]